MRKEMKKIEKEELHRIQIGILDYFAEFCDNHELRYWIDYGTLLGAIRHRGYIPWDDDIDVSMLRKDYERLMDCFNREGMGRYQFLCPEKDREYYYPFGKIVDTETVLYEMGEKGLKIGVYIDVFVVDYAPDDDVKLRKIFRKRDFYGRLRRYQLPLGQAKISAKRIGVLGIQAILKFVPRQYFALKIIHNARKYTHAETKRVCDMTDPYDKIHWVVSRKLFEDFCEVEFEGKKYHAPAKYDKWLKILYGDYMKLPSKEEQSAAQHDIEAYYIE
jgi:LPS biosynthesis protein